MQKLLHQLLVLSLCLLLPACSHYSKARLRPISKVTVTAEQKDLYKSTKKFSKQPHKQLALYLDAANAARLRLVTHPQNTVALVDYNFATSRIVEIISEANLRPWENPLGCESDTSGQWSLSLKPAHQRQADNLNLYQLSSADRYDFKGKLVGERILKEGLGAPVIAIAKDASLKEFSKYAKQGLPMFYGLTAVIQFNGRNCELQLIDPLAKENVSFNGRSYPLAADFQAPLALTLADLDLKKVELSGMFSPSKHENSARLAQLQPYDPSKTPVLFIHGLGNSPATWAPMFSYLRNDEQIRMRYQFWFFSYPTGVPYPANAAILRTQLDQMKKRYPGHKDIVVVAHSLGGNITRLLITDSGMKLWDKYFAQDPSDIPFHEDTRKFLSESLIFKARNDISRVIFASASLRGSNDATNFVGRMGAKLIGNPLAEDQITEETLEYLRPEVKAMGKKHLPNSVEILNPESQFLLSVNALPIKPGIPYHSLLGDRGKGDNLDHTKPQSSDGIVPYWSSHLDGAQSELVIPSEHWSILHPLGMAEVKRILKKY
ncbi:MAG: alpha/beta hydrolase [Verrucomicrobiota bacterium]